MFGKWKQTLQWSHNWRDDVSNHQPHDCLLNHLFKRRSKNTSKLCVTGLYADNSQVTGEFPAQMASYAENASICWRHHGKLPQVICQHASLNTDGHCFFTPDYAGTWIKWDVLVYNQDDMWIIRRRVPSDPILPKRAYNLTNNNNINE